VEKMAKLCTKTIKAGGIWLLSSHLLFLGYPCKSVLLTSKMTSVSCPKQCECFGRVTNGLLLQHRARWPAADSTPQEFKGYK
jgi:hypothetical protein